MKKKGHRTVKIFAKVDWSKAFPLVVSMSDRTVDVVRRIPNSACCSTTS